MASEYIKWQLRDLEAKEPPRPLTRKEKILNWLHYRKWHLAAGILVAGIAADLLAHALGIGVIKPDFQIAYVGASALPADTAAALEKALADLAEDANEDGRVLIQVHSYVLDPKAEGEQAAYNTASQALLMADFEDCDSCFFLLEDPARFQRDYQILARADGSLEEDPEGDPFFLAWTDCPVLSGLSLGAYEEVIAGTRVTGDSQDRLQGLYLTRRGFGSEKTCAYPEACDQFWQVLTKDAANH